MNASENTTSNLEPRTSKHGDGADDVASLDRQAWESLRALQQRGQPDLLAKVLAKYVEASHELIVAIKAAVQRGDADGLHRGAHSLKSSSATIGAYRLAELCKRGEQLGREGKLETARRVVADIEYEYDRVRALVSAELHEARS